MLKRLVSLMISIIRLLDDSIARLLDCSIIRLFKSFSFKRFPPLFRRGIKGGGLMGGQDAGEGGGSGASGLGGLDVGAVEV